MATSLDLNPDEQRKYALVLLSLRVTIGLLAELTDKPFGLIADDICSRVEQTLAQMSDQEVANIIRNLSFSAPRR